MEILVPLPKSISDMLVKLFFDVYGFVKPSDGGDALAIEFRDFSNQVVIEKTTICKLLHKMYFESCHQTVKAEHVVSAWNMIEALVDSCDDYSDIAKLIFQKKKKDKAIYYDIQGTEECVCIKKGNVEIIKKKECEVIFKNDNIANGKSYFPDFDVEQKDFINMIKEIFTISENQAVLLAAYIVSLFIPDLNHPILVITGEYGASKSTTMKMISRIVDPIKCELSQLPSSTEEAAVIIHNDYFTAFDNISYLSREMSDLFCMTVTGGVYKKRKLYSDADVSKLKIHRPIAINGIDLDLSYPDLMDRSIVLEMKRIPDEKRLTEESVWNKFYSLLPKIQGCIFKILSKALYEADETEVCRPQRLADFAKYGYCIAESIEQGTGEIFFEQYDENILLARKMGISSNPLLIALQDFMDNVDVWEGSATELLVLLRDTYLKNSIAQFVPKSFPVVPNVLSRKLNTLRTDLRDMGIEVEIGKSKERFIRILKR